MPRRFDKNVGSGIRGVAKRLDRPNRVTIPGAFATDVMRGKFVILTLVMCHISGSCGMRAVKSGWLSLLDRTVFRNR